MSKNDEISQPYPGIWMRKSEQDAINAWYKEREKQFHKWVTTEHMKFKNTPNKCIKAEGKEYWISRAMAVVGLTFAYVDQTPYILISQRGPGAADNHGKWNIPCGYLDYNETLKGAVCRELYEETGLDLQSIYEGFFPGVSVNGIEHIFTNDDPNKDARQNVSFWYRVELNVSDVELLPELSLAFSEIDEVSDARWVPFYTDELDKYEFAFNHRERLEEFSASHRIVKLYQNEEVKRNTMRDFMESLASGELQTFNEIQNG